jgi:UPF0755 protein
MGLHGIRAGVFDNRFRIAVYCCFASASVLRVSLRAAICGARFFKNNFLGRIEQPLKLLLRIFFVVFYLTCAAGFSLWVDISHYADTPASDGPPETFIVSRGMGFGSIAERLKTAGLIRTTWKFNLLARISGVDRNVQAGEYQLSMNMSPNEILEALTTGRVLLHRVTVPEGLTIPQVAEVLAAAGMTDREAFVAAATNPDFCKQLGVPADTLEGYLFPETYFFPRPVEPQDIAAAMVERFGQVFIPAWEQRAADLGFSVHEVVTLASIIEKETGAAFERPRIASVFHNRLQKKIRLQSDPTVIYGIKDFNGNLTRKHLRTPTPYNTYVIQGLPPTPIANPGADALKAALYPEETSFLFFVSRKDGTHYFSRNLQEHNQAVRKYQLRR